MRIVAFDPGRATGWCAVRLTNKGELHVLGSNTLMLDELSPAGVEDLVRRLNVDAVVIENIVSSGFLNRDKIDQIKAFDRVTMGSKNYSQTFVNPEKRKRAKINKSFPTDHERDAYRHALAFLERGGYITVESQDETEEDGGWESAESNNTG